MSETYIPSRISAFSSLMTPAAVLALLWLPSLMASKTFLVSLVLVSVVGPPSAIGFGLLTLWRCRRGTPTKEDVWLALVGLCVGIPSMWFTSTGCDLIDIRH